jgi:hypothetical protein
MLLGGTPATRRIADRTLFLVLVAPRWMTPNKRLSAVVASQGER